MLLCIAHTIIESHGGRISAERAGAGPDGRVFPAEEIQAMTLANLHGEFCTVMNAGEVERALLA